jgi:hypothetical protein
MPATMAVGDRGVRLQGGLDLLGEDLLAAGVDAHRPAPEEVDDAVLADGGGSPVRTQRLPSTSTKVSAVFSGSL